MRKHTVLWLELLMPYAILTLLLVLLQPWHCLAAEKKKVKEIRVEKRILPGNGKKGLKTRFFLVESKEFDTAGQLVRFSLYSPGELFSDEGIDSLKEFHTYTYSDGRLRIDSLWLCRQNKTHLLRVTHHRYPGEPDLPNIDAPSEDWTLMYARHYFDSAGRENRVVEAPCTVFPEGEMAVYAYDAKGRPVEESLRQEKQLEYTKTISYDDKARSSTEKTVYALGTQEVRKVYNKKDQLVKALHYTSPGQLTQETEYRYDRKGRLVEEMIRPAGRGSVNVYRYTYIEWEDVK